MSIKLHAALPSLPAALDEIREVNNKVNMMAAVAHIDYDQRDVAALTAALKAMHEDLERNAHTLAAVLKVLPKCR